MRLPLLSAALLVLSACPATKEDPPHAWLWKVNDFAYKLSPDAGPDGGDPYEARELGGFYAEEFVTQGRENAWIKGVVPDVGDNRRDDATLMLNAVPGVAGGANVAFAVTEVWQDAPAPWVQPVYMLRENKNDSDIVGQSVFGVRWGSAFYSPFWQHRYVDVLKKPEPDPTTLRDVLSLPSADGGVVEVIEGAFVLCPFAPPDAGTALVRPFTGEPLQAYAVKPGYADGAKEQWYFDFGDDTFRATPRGVISKGFIYVFAVGEKALLPRVLPNDRHLTLLQRVEVDPTGFGVALPPQYGALKAELDKAHMQVHVMEDGGVPLAYAGHVVKNPACFDAGFPGSCIFLDSEAALRALPDHLLKETPVLVTAPRLPFAAGGAP